MHKETGLEAVFCLRSHKERTGELEFRSPFLDPTPTGYHAELSPQPSTHGWHLDDFQLLNITYRAVKNVFIAICFAHDIVIFKDKFLGMKQLG